MQEMATLNGNMRSSQMLLEASSDNIWEDSPVQQTGLPILQEAALHLDMGMRRHQLVRLLQARTCLEKHLHGCKQPGHHGASSAVQLSTIHWRGYQLPLLCPFSTELNWHQKSDD